MEIPGPLTQEGVERFWSQDRLALVECADRLDRLALFYGDRDGALAGR